ncbi:reverse transcriptase domain-containing protein, partial [Tanacetum coccineum]
RPFLHTANAVIRVKQKQLNLGVGTERMTFSTDSAMKHSYSNDDTCFSIDVIDEILEEDFDALLDEEDTEPEFDEEEPTFKKITFNTDYKIKTSLEKPSSDLELKPLPDHLEYVFLVEPTFIPVIISCMLAIFHDMIKESVEVFMDDFFVFGNSFDNCLNNLDKILQRCKDANLVLNWEKCHFMVKEGIVLGHKVSETGLEVDKAKIDVISKLSPPTNVKVFAFDRFRPYLILSKTVVYTNHSALRHLFKKQDAKPRLIRWILLLQEFDIEIKDKKGTRNVAADHLSQIENDETSDDSDIDDNFFGETLIEITTKDIPWFADFANYLLGDIVPKG